MRQASLGRSRIALNVQREGAGPAWIRAERRAALQTLLNLLLIAEGQVAGRAKARIDVSATSAATGVTLTLLTSGDGPRAMEEGGEAGAARALTGDAELWAAAYLAAQHGGVVTSDDESVAISWPPGS
jgi:hypothetical protein